MINITVLGNLCNDPEIKNVNNESVLSFRMAAQTKRKDENGNRLPAYFRVSVWGSKYADYLKERLQKGMCVVVIGDFSTSEFTATDGTVHTTLDISATSVDPIGKKKEE